MLKKGIMALALLCFIIILSSCVSTNEQVNSVVPEEMYMGDSIVLEGNVEVLTTNILKYENNTLYPLRAGIGRIKLNGTEYQITIQTIVYDYLRIFVDEENLVTNCPYQLKIDCGVENPKIKIKIGTFSSNYVFDEENLQITFKQAGKFKISFYDEANLDLSTSTVFDVHYDKAFEGLRLFFVGNSLTKYTYNIPMFLDYLLDETTIDHIVRSDVKVSTYLSEHEDSLLEALDDYYYTHVILQEQSSCAATNYERFLDTVTKFKTYIDANGAKTVLYETWGYDYDDQTKKDNLREQIFLGYHNCSEANNTGLVRSGEAFRLFESLYPDVSLYALDDINHPSLAGAFLSSCTFFGYFTGQRVSDTTYAPEGIDSDLAIKLKAVADQINFGS